MDATPTAAPAAASTPSSSTPEATSTPVDSSAAPATAQQAQQAAATEVAANKLGAKEVATKPSEPRKFKVKVDGEEVTMSEEDLIKHASLGKAAYKRMEEAASLRKNVENFVDLLKKDPKRVLADPALGIDLKKFAEEIINSEIEEMKKSPEQREKEKMAKELAELREKVKAEEEARKQAEFGRLQEQEAVRLDSQITDALETSGLPKNPYMVKRVADYMLLALQNNIDVDVKDVVPLVKKELSGDLRNLFSAAPEDVLEEMVGRDSITKLRKRAIAKAKAAAPSASQIKATSASIQDKNNLQPNKKTLSMKEFLKL